MCREDDENTADAAPPVAVGGVVQDDDGGGAGDVDGGGSRTTKGAAGRGSPRIERPHKRTIAGCAAEGETVAMVARRDNSTGANRKAMVLFGIDPSNEMAWKGAMEVPTIRPLESRRRRVGVGPGDSEARVIPD